MLAPINAKNLFELGQSLSNPHVDPGQGLRRLGTVAVQDEGIVRFVSGQASMEA